VSAHRKLFVMPVAAALVAILVVATTASAATIAAAHRPHHTARPAISGTAAAGDTLRATRGRWVQKAARRPTGYRFAWLRCNAAGRRCATIARAHRHRYGVRTADAGHRLRVRVTAVKRLRPPLVAHGRTLASSVRSHATGVVAAANGGGPGVGPTPPDGGPPASGLRVAGNTLIDGAGHAVHLHGVNYSGTEYACVQGWGIFEGGGSGPSLVAGISAWHANVVRVPLNEQCWLGSNGVNPAYSDTNYQNAIRAFVDRLRAAGIYVELSLMWAAPETGSATYQPEAPDADHSPAFWASLANAYKDVPGVMLAPWGETTVSASCFLAGGCTASFKGSPYTTAGMQQAVTVMRDAGFAGPIVIPGVDYANDLSQWLSHEPSDPLHQLVAEAHVYGGNSCDTTSCLDSTMAPVAAKVPLVFGETGETYGADDCGSSYIATFLNWADAHGVGYEAWQYDPWGNCLDLISKWDGTVADSDYARWVQTHYASLP
jgi:hypothetical protein